MSGVIAKMKKESKILGQKIKEKTGLSSSDVDPVYQNACEKYKKLNEEFNQIKSDMDVIIDSAQKASQSGVEMAKVLAKADENNGNTSKEILNPITTFFSAGEKNVKEKFTDPASERIVTNFTEVLKKMEYLGELKKKRDNTSYYVNSLNGSIKKLADQNDAEKLTKVKIELAQNQEDLKNQTNEFVTAVNEIYNNKVNIVETAMQEFFAISFNFAVEMNRDVNMLSQTVNYEYDKRNVAPGATPYYPQVPGYGTN